MDVDLEALDQAADEFARVATALRDVDVTGPVAGIGDALPGAMTGEAVLWFSTRAGAAVRVLADHFDELSASASGTAADYRAADAAAQSRIGGLGTPR